MAQVVNGNTSELKASKAMIVIAASFLPLQVIFASVLILVGKDEDFLIG